jgi:hypothetical protein
LSDFVFYCGGGLESRVEDMKNCYLLSPSESQYLVNQKNDLLSPRSYHAVIASGNHVYVIGGKDNMGVATSKFDSYSLKKNHWTVLENLPKLMERVTVAIIGQKFYITDFYSRIIFVYDIDNATFKRINTLVP